MSNTINIYNEEQFNKEVKMVLSDNGDWEYARLGIGEDKLGVFVFDMNDSGEEEREKTYTQFETVDEALNFGCDIGVFTKDSEGTVYVDWENEANDELWNKFEECFV